MTPKRRAGSARGWARALGARTAAAAGEAKALRRSQLRFALTFALVAGALFSLYAFPYAVHGRAERCFQAYLRGYAHLAGFILSIFDRHVGITDNVISGRFSLAIVKTCDAMEANLLFLAAIVAFPVPWRRKLSAAILGIGALVAVNVIRICSLYFVGAYAPSAFELLHIEVWPLLIVLVAAGLFAGWASRMVRTRPSSVADAGL